MPKFVTALFDESTAAQQAVQMLEEIGFKRPDIQIIDGERQARGFFDRLFVDENGGGNHDDLRMLGIARDDVAIFNEAVRRGGALVVMMCDKARLDEARRTLEQFEPLRLMTPDDEKRYRAAKKRGEVTPGRADEREPKKWFDVVEVDEEDPREGAKSHAVHIRARSDVEHQTPAEMPGGRSTPFSRHEREFRVHYSENYADSHYRFDDYRLAYRYGMALAENRGLYDQQWSSIEDHARQGWKEHTSKPWSPFAEAVWFGWRTIRRHRRSEGRRGRPR